MFKAVLFDMDGVLAFTEGFYNRRRVQFLREKGLPVDPDFDGTGSNDAEIWERLVPGDADLRQKLHVEYRAYSDSHPTPWREVANPQAKDVIKSLHQMGVRVAICSSSYRALIDEFVAELGLAPYLDLVISGEECVAYKPDPDIYLTAMARLNVRCMDAVVVEDSPIGIEAGLAAGAFTCALTPPDGAKIDQSAAHLGLRSLEDVRAVLTDCNSKKTAMIEG